MGELLVTAGLVVTAAPANALDVNQASAQQLEGIRGIGPRTAEIIVGERERGGKFDSFEDLAERVRGIGLKKAQALESAGLQVGAAASSGPPAASAAKSVAIPAAASANKAGGRPAATAAANSAATPAAKPAAKPAVRSGPP